MALIFQGEEMTYATLDAKSNQLANALIDKGLRKTERVGIFMHKNLDLGVAIYEILKAGGVFVPLDLFLPVERLEFILQDCQIRHLASSDRLAPQISALGADLALEVYGVGPETPFPGIDWAAIYAYPASPPDVSQIDQGLGYIMYTSGSTSQPRASNAITNEPAGSSKRG